MNKALTKLPNPVRFEWNGSFLEKASTEPSLNALAEWLLVYAKASRVIPTHIISHLLNILALIKCLGKCHIVLEIVIKQSQSINS